MKYMPAFFLLLLVTFNTAAQSSNYIIGTVLSGETGMPVSNASVFITSTSKGTVSSSTGEFRLDDVPVGNYDLVISCIGYETQVYSYKAGQLPLRLKVQMTRKSEELQAVIVEPYEKNGWEKWGKFFMENFIGTSGYAKGCSIKNYKTIHFRHSKKKNQLTVTASEPLIIENKTLGYKIQYQLEGFNYLFKDGVLVYFGYTLFNELNKKGPTSKQLKNRDKVYKGSMVHFMKSVYQNRLLEEGFEVKRLYKSPNNEKARVKNIYATSSLSKKLIEDSTEYYDRILRQPDMLDSYGKDLLSSDSLITKTDTVNKYLFFKNYLYVVFKNANEDPEYLEYIHENRNPYFRRSVVFLPNSTSIAIDAAGNYSMPQDFMSYGYWSWSEKIATMLPIDYKLALK